MKIYNYLLFFLLLVSLGFCVSTGSNSGGSGISIQKKDGFNSFTKRVSTLNVYHIGKKKLGDKSDLILNTLGVSVDGKISEIYGEGIVGGDAITNLAIKLRLKNFELAVQNLVESQISEVSFTENSKKTLSTITEKGKIDAIAVPAVTDGFDTLKTGGKVDLYIIIFDGKSGNIQILGKKEGISAKPEDIALLETKPDQARANMNLSMLNNSNELLDAIKKEIKSNTQNVASAAETEKPKTVSKEAYESKETDKESEALSGVDEWLVNKTKFGLGPMVMVFTALLFLFL